MAYKRYDKKVAYDVKYVKEHYDRYDIKLPKGLKEQLKTVASSESKSVNEWINEAIQEKLKGQSS